MRVSFGWLRALGFGATFLVGVGGRLGCAYLPFVSADEWQTVGSKRFVVASNSGLGHVGVIEALEQAHALLESSVFASKPIAPVDVLLLDWPEFRRLFGDRRTHVVVGKLPGKGVVGQRGMIVMYGRDGSLSGAIHRLSHLFLHAVAPKAPLWIHEGMAAYLEGATYSQGTGTEAGVCLGHLPPKAPEVSIDELLGLTFTSFDDSEKASGQRLAASNLVDYFFMADGGKYREPFFTFIEAVAEGGDQIAALAKVFGGLTPAQLQEKSREHRKSSGGRPRGLCPIPYTVGADKAADTAKPTVKPAETKDIERVRTQLSLLPRRRGQIDWFPPDMIGVAGGQFSGAVTAEKNAAKEAETPAAAPAGTSTPAGAPAGATTPAKSPPAKPPASTPSQTPTTAAPPPATWAPAAAGGASRFVPPPIAPPPTKTPTQVSPQPAGIKAGGQK
jgi:hypothetical protein